MEAHFRSKPVRLAGRWVHMTELHKKCDVKVFMSSRYPGLGPGLMRPGIHLEIKGWCRPPSSQAVVMIEIAPITIVIWLICLEGTVPLPRRIARRRPYYSFLYGRCCFDLIVLRSRWITVYSRHLRSPWQDIRWQCIRQLHLGCSPPDIAEGFFWTTSWLDV